MLRPAAPDTADRLHFNYKEAGAGGRGYTRKLTRERQRANQGVRLNNFSRNRAKLLCASQTTSFLSNYYPPPPVVTDRTCSIVTLGRRKVFF